MKLSLVKTLTVFLTLLALIFSASRVTPAYAAAATITVTTIADSTDPDGYCSLREAIANANNNAATFFFVSRFVSVRSFPAKL